MVEERVSSFVHILMLHTSINLARIVRYIGEELHGLGRSLVAKVNPPLRALHCDHHTDGVKRKEERDRNKELTNA